MNDAVLRIPRPILYGAIGLVLVLVVLVLIFTGVIARATTATALATRSDLAAQQAAAERDVERAYEQAIGQVRKVRALKLAIPDKDADAISNKALTDLHNLRHSAFISLGQTLGAVAADAETYASGTDGRFDARPILGDPSPVPVLLAPKLYAIVSRMSDLAGQLSDKATKDLTEPAAPAPTPSPTPIGAPRPSATPSPTR